MNRIPEPYELCSNDPRSPYFDDGYRPKLPPKFKRKPNPDHLKLRNPHQNPNPNPDQELIDGPQGGES